MKILCKILGHKADLVERAILRIKRKAINKEEFKNEYITCKRCKKKITN